MATFTRSQSLLVSVSLAALGGTALATLLAGGGLILADARATAVDVSLPIADADIPICGPPTATARPNMMFRLVQTEVPRAEMSAASPAPAFADTEPPLWTGIGSTTWKITTANERAQAYFDQGLRLAYAFNHDEARRAFRMAQKLDPDCAMCFWGEALVLGPNINLPMPEDAVAPAYAAAQKAKALAGKASPREQALIGAIAVRYGSDPKAARAPLDAAYAAEMAKAAKQFAEDDEIATLYAEAVMDLSPWDYWKPGGRDAKPQSVPIVPTLERVLARNPNHAGAIHLYIHAVEASDRPKRAEPYADKLRGAIPGAGHLVHMPSHIYYRVGRYLDALEDNKTAVKVDEKYLTETNAPMGVYRLGYYPHNVHFVMASAQMAGDGPTVIAAAEKLGQLIPSEAAKGIAMVQPVKAAPYFAHAQFSTPETILALPDPGDAIPYVKAMWLYVRGVALVANRDFAGATAAASAIETIERTADFKLLKDFRHPGAGGAPHRAHGDPRTRSPGQGRLSHRHHPVRTGGGIAGRLGLHRAALLVLSDPAVACRRPAAGRPLRRGGAAIPARAQPGARQWLVVLRAGGTAQVTRQWPRSPQGRGRPCQNLDRRPQAVADFKSLKRHLTRADEVIE